MENGDTLELRSDLIQQWIAQGYDYNREFSGVKKKTVETAESSRNISPNFNIPAVSEQMAKFVAIFIGLALVGLAFYLYMRSFVSLKTKQLTITEEDTIYDINFADSIKQMEQEENYYQCIRLKYLSLLRTLHDSHRISWLPHKTATQYIYEMKREESFVQFTNMFLRVRYGNYPATADLWQEAKLLHDNVLKKKGGQL